jgi:hypothetical protein
MAPGGSILAALGKHMAVSGSYVADPGSNLQLIFTEPAPVASYYHFLLYIRPPATYLPF